MSKLDVLADVVVQLAGGEESAPGTRILDAGVIPAKTLVLAVKVCPQDAPTWTVEPATIAPGFIVARRDGLHMSDSAPILAPADLDGNADGDSWAAESIACPTGAELVVVLEGTATPEASAGSVRVTVCGVSL